MIGLKGLVEEREWEVVVVSLVAGQRSVREKEWLETLRIFGIGKEDGQRIIGRLDRTLLDEHAKLFGRYWWHTFGPSSSFLKLLGRTLCLTSCPLYIYCKICANLFKIYLLFSPSFITLCSPPRLRVQSP
jgi:hypothetical protein